MSCEHKFDVICCNPLESRLQLHHCRSFELVDNSWVGCFGTFDHHGLTFDDAKQELLDFLKIHYTIEKDHDEILAGKIRAKIDYWNKLSYDEFIDTFIAINEKDKLNE